MWQYRHTDELTHHGVLGMKWGVHRTKTQLGTGNKKNKKSKLTTDKSKRRLKLEASYRTAGLTKKEAEQSADKRIRTEKIVASVAGMTIAAAATYVAIKHYKDTVDKTIKLGTKLQNISTNPNKGVEDAFYSSMNKQDNVKYRGLYGKQLKAPWLNDVPVYETKFKAVKEIKVASKKNATETLKNMMADDPTAAKSITEHLKSLRFPTAKQNKIVNEATSALKKGNVNSKVYEAFNLSLTDHSNESANKAHKDFYSLLTKKGYGAIQDINDIKYSGYRAKKPAIVFGGAKTLTVDKVRKVGVEEINKTAQKAMTNIRTEAFIKSGAKYAAVFGGAKVVKNQIDKDYTEKHK